VVCLSRKKPDIGVIHIPLDYTDETSIIRASKEIEEKYNTFDIVIHCTGIGYIEALSEMNYAHSVEMMSVNLLGPSILSAQLLPLVQKNQADILYV
jgi:short-subunit dehydrogenase